MRGHIIKRGDTYSYVVDVDGQQAQRCTECKARQWVERERPAATCAKCGELLGEAHGERRQVWKAVGTSKKEAERALREYLALLDQGADPFPTDMTFREWVDRWKDSDAYRRLRPSTAKRYTQMLQDHFLPSLGAMPVMKIHPRHLRAEIDTLAAKGRSVREAKAIVSSVLRAAVEVGLIEVNPAAGVRAAGKPRKRLVVPSSDDVRALLDAVEGTVWEVPLWLAAYTGMRRSEVLGLAWSSVILADDVRVIRVERGLHRHHDADGTRLEFLPPKSDKSEREFVIAPTLAARLRRWKSEQAQRHLLVGQVWQSELDLVCDRGDGGALDPDAMTHAFKRAATKAGLPDGVRLHDLRHGAATTLLAKGVDPKIVSAMLGHSTVSFTQDQYQHVLRAMTSPAADALDQALGGASPLPR